VDGSVGIASPPCSSPAPRACSSSIRQRGAALRWVRPRHVRAFEDVNRHFAEWSHAGVDDVGGIYGRAAARDHAAIAFAYTYHYLNWFSKTSVIQRHKIPRPATPTSCSAAVGLYA
jgi:hypothetical protein